MKCLEKDPADRPRSAPEVLSVLDSPDAIAGPVAAPPRAVATRRRNRWKAWLATALPIVAVSALFAFALWPSVRENPAPAPAAAPASRSVVIRVSPADSIGPGSGQLATAISAAIETALVQSGLSVSTAATNPTASTFVVNTTVQRVGQRARANVRMVAERDSAVWADQMDFRVDSSFVAQDSIAARVVRAARDAVARVTQP